MGTGLRRGEKRAFIRVWRFSDKQTKPRERAVFTNAAPTENRGFMKGGARMHARTHARTYVCVCRYLELVEIFEELKSGLLLMYGAAGTR